MAVSMFRLHALLCALLLTLSTFVPFGVYAFPASISNIPSDEWTCRNEAYHPLDYSVKVRPDPKLPVCAADSTSAVLDTRHILGRQVTQETDYSCSESRPCRNGACCPKETGWCNYGPKACGTTNTSPNEVCWSNCDAKAECGRFADPPGKECPLNVCCSAFGFCGMTEEFCKVTKDKETSCQSNCKQPGSGSSGGNVRERVVGYYEAWVHTRKCNGMSIEQIPVGALTHLMFSFGYITPGDFKIIPMDDLDPKLFSKMTALKKRNRNLKVMIALGGWTFNDPSPWQSVFHDICSTQTNRATFIANLLSFMRQYAFDGVDFDWEYPGATDRGGHAEDGKNFTKLLKELKAAIKKQPVDYEVSFTTPTSYWYLRHFDLKESAAAVDFVNIMSYDLHGVWDADNPIGSKVLAHTNITELKLALDLYWRNDVSPAKLNLGLGFYGRSFELSDSSCYKPGCQFRGGARKGPCTDNSGTLSYFEIKNIIKEKKLKPYYDKQHQVKYIVWDENQWVSYDDAETIKAKMDFANKLGLGGVLIWSLDQDTKDLEALTAVVGTKAVALAMKDKTSEDTGLWQDIGNQGCYVTGCGGKCKNGFRKIESQPCGSVHWFFRTAGDDDSLLCCPLSAAPDPDDCKWRGEAPACNGRCHDGEVLMQTNPWGNGKYCEGGSKAYCCKAAQEHKNNCYWSGMGNQCKAGDKPLTFKGTWLGAVADVASLFGIVGDLLGDLLDDLDIEFLELYCCPKEDFNRWKNQNCHWKGSKSKDCSDNTCTSGKEIQLANSVHGEGLSCFPFLDRARVFCCDPPEGSNLFLPVPLDDLLPNPPTGDDVKTRFDLNVDNTWGDGEADTDTDDDPDEAAFQFYVLASHKEIQVSLDKRDGSHWEVYNCNDPVSEEEQTVQMICTDNSDSSTCNDIFLGRGAPGTIIEMPRGKGCGPGKYAVVKALEVAKDQGLPPHLVKRGFTHKPTVYDLTFDYDFLRVPRDDHQTQMRIDFSNQEGYWDNIVAKPKDGGKKSKRSLEDVGGNHKRWIEEEWRDDYHRGELTTEQLHKRWFGSSAVDWLKGLLDIKIKKEKRHDYEEDISAIILQEEWTCNKPNFKFKAKVEAVATASIKMSTSFGFTLITTLGPGMDLSKSFLHFNNEGGIEAIFTLEALMTMQWDSKVFSLGELPVPGASFRIPGIVTIGPEIRLDARFKAGISVEGRVEARVTLADWEIRQTYPQQSNDYVPKIEDSPDRGIDAKGLSKPTFDYSLRAEGYAEAHIIPTISFGINFDKRYEIGSCAVELAGDGWARMRVRSDIVGGSCGFGYAVDAGASLKVQAKVPDAFDWKPAPLTIGNIERTLIPDNGDEYLCVTGGAAPRSLDMDLERYGFAQNESDRLPLLRKRLVPYGPLITIPGDKKLCPNKGGTTAPGPCLDQGAVEGFYKVTPDSDLFDKRSLAADDASDPELDDFEYIEAQLNSTLHLNHFDRRAIGKRIVTCSNNAKHNVMFQAWPQDSTFEIYDNEAWDKCNNYQFGIQPNMQDVPNKRGGGNQKYPVEHILEAHLIQGFMSTYSELCKPLNQHGWSKGYIPIDGEPQNPWDYVAKAWPYTGYKETEFVRIITDVNVAKETAFKKGKIAGEGDMAKACTGEDTVDAAIKTMKIVLMAYRYINTPKIRGLLVTQSDRVAERLDIADEAVKQWNKAAKTDYETKDLGDKWKKFIKTRTEETFIKFDKFFKDWMPKIEAVLAPFDEKTDSQTTGRAERREKIKALRKAVDERGSWTNPF